MTKSALRLLLLMIMLAVPVPAAAAPSELTAKLSTLSNAGNAEATYHLGMLFHVGLQGVEKDQRKAFELFKRAAELGDPLGAYKYGCYFDGQGQGIVDSDPKLALRWKLVAAEAGYTLAQEDVAQHLFDEGETARALQWLEASASQGSPMALGLLGGLYAGLMPPEVKVPAVPKDEAKGWAYLLLSVRDMPEMRSSFEAELAKLNPDVQKRAQDLISSWKANPTELSESEGIAAAYKLVGLPVPQK
jgi:TPR repeat protein